MNICRDDPPQPPRRCSTADNDSRVAIPLDSGTVSCAGKVMPCTSSDEQQYHNNHKARSPHSGQGRKCTNNGHKTKKKDCAPVKPCKFPSSLCYCRDGINTQASWLDETTITTDVYDLLFTFNNNEETTKIDAVVQAREQPNIKVPTTPIKSEDDVLKERLKVLQDFWKYLNAHDLVALREHVCADDFRFVFVGTEHSIMYELDFDEFQVLATEVFAAFPDFHFMYSSIEESLHPEQQGGVLVVKEFASAGTHMGKPFGLGPSYPPIPAARPPKRIVLDECECYNYFDPVTNRIVRSEEVAMGEITGIFGIYELLQHQSSLGR